MPRSALAVPLASIASIVALLCGAACGDPHSGHSGTDASAHHGASTPPSSSPSSLGSSAPSSTGAAEPAPRPASAAELAILAPAVVGTALGDFTIREVRGVDHGTMELVCEKGAARVILSIALVTADGPSPPASTDRYGVFYSLRGATPEDGERLAKALTSLLTANASAPPPPGMGPFVPRPLSL